MWSVVLFEYYLFVGECTMALLRFSVGKECHSTVREEALYQTMLSVVTPTLRVFHIILVLTHINVFTYCPQN